MTIGHNRYHHTIMANEVIDHIPEGAQWILDGTVGHGGHTHAMIDHMCQKSVDSVNFVGVDKDHQMLSVAQERLSEQKKLVLGHCAYDERDSIRKISGTNSFDYILLDIGINRGHIRDASRGFSIKGDGPLDMRFNASETNTGITAAQYIETIDVKVLAHNLEKYGDISPDRAEKIALHMTRSQRSKPILTTFDLIEVLKSINVNGRYQAIIFQVLRIVVNDELGHLERFLENFGDHLNVGGRCAIMTFHSIEDRIIKQSFKALSSTDSYKLINKKVIKPHRQEREKNKASRSAKLRIIERSK